MSSPLSKSDEKVVKVAAVVGKPPGSKFPPDDYEYLWAIVADDDEATIDNIPFFTRGLHYKDRVALRRERTPKAEFIVSKVLEPSGHSTIYVALNVGDESLSWLQSAFGLVLAEFKKLGCDYERSGDWYYALDIPPDPKIRSLVLEILAEGSREGKWEFDDSTYKFGETW